MFWPHNVAVALALNLKNSQHNVLQGGRIPERPPVLLLSTVWWVFQRGGGEVHLEMLRAAAVTSHSISLFYGHERLRSSPSPFGASLETSAGLFYLQPLSRARSPLCVVSTLRFRKIS